MRRSDVGARPEATDLQHELPLSAASDHGDVGDQSVISG